MGSGEIQSDDVLEVVFASDRVGVAILDGELRYVRINRLLAAVNQRSIADHIGRTVEEVVGDAVPALTASLQRVLESGEPILDAALGEERVRLRMSVHPTRARDALVVLCVQDHEAERDSTLRERLELELTLSRVAARLVAAGSEDLDVAIEVALAEVGRIQGVERVTVHRVDAAARVAEVTHAWHGDAPTLRSWPVGHVHEIEGDWFVDRLLEGRPIVLDDLDALPLDAAASRSQVEREGLGAMVVAPLAPAGRLIGAVVFASSRPRRWAHPFAARVGLFSEILAGAIARQRLEREAARRAELDELLRELAESFVERPFGNPSGVLDRICKALGMLRIHVFEVDWATRVGILLQDGGAPGHFRAGERRRFEELAPPLMHREPTDASIVYVREDEMTPENAAHWRANGIGAALVVPLMVDGSARGTLGFSARSRADFTPEFLERVALLRGLFSTALARAQSERAREATLAELEALKSRAERERDYLRQELGGNRELVYVSARMREVIDRLDAVAETPATVLLVGETGVGKELLARALHARSDRRNGPLIKVNCASVPAELFESEFFGHVRGAFTGAHRDRRGRFELADGGTLFLDEVGEIPMALQSKLLRVLQEGELERVGDDRTLRVDVRVVAATNRDLEAEIEAGRFRRDLYYRLSVFPLTIPPLRERTDDIPRLARAFLHEHSARLGRRGLTLRDADLARLCAYSWPGNVRELSHVIERAVILSTSPPLRLDLGPQLEAQASERPATILTADELRALERANILAALEASPKIAGPGGAAERLGMNPSTLRDRMLSLGITRRGRRAR